mgnify:CR=1 FL=1
MGLERVSAVPDRREERRRELAPQDRGGLEDALVLLRRAGRCARVRTPCTVSGTGRPALRPWSPTARASSSRKNGLPSALSRISRASGSPASVAGRTDRTMARLSSAARRRERDLSREGAIAPGRSVAGAIGRRRGGLTRRPGSRRGTRSIPRTSDLPSGGPRLRARAAAGGCRAGTSAGATSKVRALMTSGPGPRADPSGSFPPSRRSEIGHARAPGPGPAPGVRSAPSRRSPRGVGLSRCRSWRARCPRPGRTEWPRRRTGTGPAR